MPDSADAALAAILSRTPVRTADDVLGVLSDIVRALPPGNGIWCFAKLYAAVTSQVREELRTANFRDPAWIDRLDAVFGNLFFRAIQLSLEGNPEAPRAWYPLFSLRNERRAALQFAVAGMNAHINRDLPVALVGACEAMGIDLSRSSPEYQDYVSVNPILAQVEARVKGEFLTGELAIADELFGKVDDLVANFSIAEARAGAWTHAETLWALRGNAMLSSAFLDTLDGLVGFASRGLLVKL